MTLLLAFISFELLVIIWIMASGNSTKPAQLLKAIDTFKPKPNGVRGAIIEPIDEATLALQEKLDKAKKDGIDIRLEDLDL
jgi:hypothetical protein